MTRKEFMEIVSEYKHLLHDVNIMKLKFGSVISRLEEQQALSEDEAEYKEWLKEVYEGLQGVLF